MKYWEIKQDEYRRNEVVSIRTGKRFEFEAYSKNIAFEDKISLKDGVDTYTELIFNNYDWMLEEEKQELFDNRYEIARLKDSRDANIQFQKSGSGSINARINLPITWVRELGIDEENRNVKISYEFDKIIIEKIKE